MAKNYIDRKGHKVERSDDNRTSKSNIIGYI